MTEIEREWRCFFCDEVFTDRAKASEHFGCSLDSEPLCKIAAVDGGLSGKLREFEEQLIPYRIEDSETERRMAAMASDHGMALRREEEKGYAKGLADGLKLERVRTPAEIEQLARDNVTAMARKAVDDFVTEGGFALIPLRSALRTLDFLIGDVDKL